MTFMPGMIAAAGLLLMVVPFSVVHAQSSDFKLVLLEKEAKTFGAVCLDGSPGAFYFRPGTETNKFLIFYEGGGWCYSQAECYSRSNTHLGSSRSYEDTMQKDTGYFSQDPSVNPLMYSWNMVFIKYCDGASYSGNNDTVDEFEGKKLYYRGFRINMAVMDRLFDDFGLFHATDVVLTGCSAGGLATYLHVDHWAGYLNPSTKFVAMPDSGFFLDYEAPDIGPSPVPSAPGNYHNDMIWVYEYQNASTGVNQACVHNFYFKGEDYLCMFAQHTAPFIQTPLFVLQSRFDSWQQAHVLKDGKNSAIVNELGRNITALVEHNVLNRGQNAAFLDSCNHHCYLFGDLKVNGIDQGQAMKEWYEKQASQQLWEQQQDYPCTECCPVKF